MAKDKKITIKPFLNERVAPLTLPIEGDGFHSEAQFLPLYYQIIFDRKNTHLAASTVFGGSNKPYLFSSLEYGSREYHTQKTSTEIIRRDSHLIELIIRYETQKSGSFELKGLKGFFQLYERNFFEVINESMKDFMLYVINNQGHTKFARLFNFNDKLLSFYFIFTTFQKLFNVFEVFSTEQILHIQNLKACFEMYQHELGGSYLGSSNHTDNVLGAIEEKQQYSVIQWLCGEMEQEFKHLIHINGQVKTQDQLRNSIQWLLDEWYLPCKSSDFIEIL